MRHVSLINLIALSVIFSFNVFDMEWPVEINTVEICEALGLGQQVQEYKVEGQVDSDWKLLSHGTTIGDSKIDRFPNVIVWKVKLTILKAQPYTAIRKFGIYFR